MQKGTDVEFKSLLTETEYNKLLDFFGDMKSDFQTNHYFDTENTDLIQEQTVLRIRQKCNNYKLTKKTRALVGADETHIFLSKEKAEEMLKSGFDASIIGLPYQVSKVAELTTYRASSHYKNGKIFFDRSEYYGQIDYEIEYEVDEINQGKKDFKEFLDSHNIEYKESIRKSKRAFDNKR